MLYGIGQKLTDFTHSGYNYLPKYSVIFGDFFLSCYTSDVPGQKRPAYKNSTLGNTSAVTGVWSTCLNATMSLADHSLWCYYWCCHEYIRAPVIDIISFFVFRKLFVLKRDLGIMDASSDECFRKCVSPCQRYLTLDDTHDLCVDCLGEDHASSVLEQAE